ncbi:MAG: hypothetical protein ACI9WU_003632 [Myxococcota bacterium]|jgi:hypothetical protein
MTHLNRGFVGWALVCSALLAGPGCSEDEPDGLLDVAISGQDDAAASDAAVGDAASPGDVLSDVLVSPDAADVSATDDVDPSDAADAGGDAGDGGSACGPPTTCGSDADCTGDEKCIGTQCVAPAPPGPFLLTGTTGLLATVSLPSPPDSCCEDVDGDGIIDNQLAAVASTTPSVAAQVEKYLADATAIGRFKYIVDVKGAPASGCGPVDVAIYRADDDVDDDGLPDSVLDEQLAGNGVFQATANSLRPDGYGAVVQFNGSTLENGVITSPVMTFPFDFVLPDGTVITAPVENAVMQMTLGPFGAAAKPGVPGTSHASFGGYVRLSNIMDALNEQSKFCACAGIDITQPMGSWTIAEGQFLGQCDQVPATSDFNCPVGTPDVCKNLTASCGAAMLFGAFADISSGTVGADGTTAKDAVSFGLYFELVNAGLAPANVAPGFVAVGDTWEALKALVVPANAPAVQLAVLANDIYDPAAQPVIISVTAGSLGSTVEVDATGLLVNYTPKPLVVGVETFTYTIQDAAGGQTSTATVTTSIQQLSTLHPNCIDYCNAVQIACTAADQQYASFAACFDHCITASAMPIGAAGDTAGNSVGCRSTVAETINLGMSDAAADCAAAGPTGGGVCGTYCEVYCALMTKNCPDSYATPTACADACSPMDTSGQANAAVPSRCSWPSPWGPRSGPWTPESSDQSSPEDGYLMGNPRFSDMLRSVVTPLFSDEQVFFAFASESQEDLLALNALIEAGDLKATIDEVVPMERIAEAHTRVETEQRLGSIVMSHED